MVRRSKEGRTARRVAGVGRRAGRGRKPHQRSRLRPLVMSAAATIAAGFLQAACSGPQGSTVVCNALYIGRCTLHHACDARRCTALHECYTRDARHPT